MPSELEVAVKRAGAAIVSKTEETTQVANWGFNSDGSMTANSGNYHNEYKRRLVFDYNGVRFTAYNFSPYRPYLDHIYAGPIE